MPHSKQSNLGQKSLIALAWSVSGAGAQAILRFIVLILIARLMGPEQFGVVSIALIVISLAQLFSTMGVGPAIVQKKYLSNEIVSNGFFLSNMLGIFCMLCLFLFSDHIALFFDMPKLNEILKVLSLIFPISALATVSESLLQRELKFKAFVVRDAISYIVGYGMVGVSLAFFEYGAWAIVWAHLVQATLKTAIIMRYQRHNISLSIDKRICADMLKFGLGISGAKIANFFATQIDNIIAGKILGATLLGVYSRAFQFIAMPAALLGGELSKVLFSAISSIQDQRDRVYDALRKSVSLVFLTSTPLTILVVFSAESIITGLLGEQWIDAVIPMQLLAVTLPFRTAYRIDNAIANGLGSVYPRAWREVVYAILVLVFCYAGAFYSGVAGIAAGASCAALVNFVLMHDLSLRLLKESWRNTLYTIGFNIFLVLPMVLTILILNRYLMGYGSLLIVDIAIAGLAIIVHGLILFLMRSHLRDEIVWIRKKIGK